MTNDQLRGIINNAPEGATHVLGDNAYCNYYGTRNSDLDDSFDFYTFVNNETNNSGFNSLADLREILDLRERVEKAERERNEILKAVYDWQDCDTASQSKRAQIEMYEIVKRLRGKTRGR